MSKLLKDAIIDAKAIKNAALKTAENMILEKYAPDVKKSLEKLLTEEVKAAEESPDPVSFSPLEDEPTSEEDTFSDVPSAVADGERLCRCPDEEEEIEINLPELAKQVGGELKQIDSDLGLDMPSGEASPQNDMPLPGEEDEEGLPLKESCEQDEIEEEDLIKEIIDNEDLIGSIETELDHEDDEEEEGEEEDEALSVDIEKKHQPLGHIGGATMTDRKNEIERHLAANGREKEELEETKKLKESIRKLKSENEELNKKFLALESLTRRIAKKAEEINLTNAKLQYTNNVLTDKSLNDRQKNQIAESLKKTKSVQEAKTLFETLKSAVGSSGERAQELKSLNEAINSKVARTYQARQSEVDDETEMVKQRMQTLAAIRPTRN